MSELELDFVKHLEFISSGIEKTPLDLEFPVTGSVKATGFANFMESYSSIDTLQHWVLIQANLKAFTWADTSYIRLTFTNGDVVILGITGYASITNYPILVVVDEDGNIISTLLTNGGTSESIDGGGSVLITLPNVPYVFCYGVCTNDVPPGTVIIRDENP